MTDFFHTITQEFISPKIISLSNTMVTIKTISSCLSGACWKDSILSFNSLLTFWTTSFLPSPLWLTELAVGEQKSFETWCAFVYRIFLGNTPTFLRSMHFPHQCITQDLTVLLKCLFLAFFATFGTRDGLLNFQQLRAGTHYKRISS